MEEHILWALPEKYDQNLLNKSLSLENKELFFLIPQQQKLTIQFKVKTDFKSFGIQTFKFSFNLKKNDNTIFKTPFLQRKFRNDDTAFTQSLSVDSSSVFNQTQDKYIIEIFAQEIKSSEPSIPISKAINLHESSENSFNQISSTDKIDIDQIKTPEHLFSPNILKENSIRLEDLDPLEPKPIIENILNETPPKIEITQIINTAITDDLFSKPQVEKENSEKSHNSESNIISTNNDDFISNIPSISDEIMPGSPFAKSPFSSNLSSPSPMKKKKKKKKLSDYNFLIKTQDSDDERPNLSQESQSSEIDQHRNIASDVSFSQQEPGPELDLDNATNTGFSSQPAPNISDDEEPVQQPRPITRSINSPSSEKVFQKKAQPQTEPHKEIRVPKIVPSTQQPPNNETYCGLYNQGATCYMNSMLQAFYHLPAFRRLIYQMDTTIVSDNDKDKGKTISSSSNIPLQLQKLFARMQTTKERACSTRDLTKSFGWTDEDTIMQHDVQEFCRVLLDNLETKIDKQPQLKGSIQNLFRGKIRSYIRCTDVDFESKRDEYFYDLSLDVKGCSKLKDSFYKYIEKEKLNGKNQYDTGDPRYGKQDAVMGNEFIEFPPVLHLHLRRFEFNGSGMSKINSRFEFPTEINLSKFMAKDGVDRDNQIYELFGVLVHSGTVDGGHYYAFLRPTEKQKWYEFNDSSVSSVSPRDAIENNYGGSSSSSSSVSDDIFKSRFNRNNFMNRNNHHHHHHFGSFNNSMQQQRWFSAYMLVYIRKRDIPFIYKRVSTDEIPDEIKELIMKEEEIKRKKEEQKRIEENTVVFHIYTFLDIGKIISKTNKFCLPAANDASIGKKYTALRGEKFSVLYDKIFQDVKNEKQSENEDNNTENTDNTEATDNESTKLIFELWPISYSNIENSPIKNDKIITFPSSQSLFLYSTVHPQNEEEEENEEKEPKTQSLFNIVCYPYVIIFVFVYTPGYDNPIQPLQAIKVKKKDPVRVLFEASQSFGIACNALYKCVQLQSLEEITNIDSTIEENKLKSGSFVIFESIPQNEMLNANISENHIEEKDNVLICRYQYAYKTKSVLEYLDILRNLTLIRVSSADCNNIQMPHDIRVYFPKNRAYIQFIFYLKLIFKIPESRTVLLYESRSKTPVKFVTDKAIGDYTNLSSSFILFQFDQLANNVFDHSLLIKYRVVGSLVSIIDSLLNCWLNEESTISDFIEYVANSTLAQLQLNYQNMINNRMMNNSENVLDLTAKEFIRHRVIIHNSYFEGPKIKVFSLKNENMILHSDDTKISSIESTLYVDIDASDQFICDDIILNDLRQQQQQQQHVEQQEEEEENNIINNVPESLPVHLFVTDNAMNKLCQCKEQGNTIIKIFDGETLLNVKKRLTFLLNKSENYFTQIEGNSFVFSLLQSNSLFKITLKDNDLLFPSIKKGYTKLRVALSMAAVYRNSSSSSHSNKDDSVIIKN